MGKQRYVSRCAVVLSCAIAKFALQGATLLRSVALNVQGIVI